MKKNTYIHTYIYIYTHTHTQSVNHRSYMLKNCLELNFFFYKKFIDLLNLKNKFYKNIIIHKNKKVK